MSKCFKFSPHRQHFPMCSHLPPLKHSLHPEKSEVLQWLKRHCELASIEEAIQVFEAARHKNQQFIVHIGQRVWKGDPRSPQSKARARASAKAGDAAADEERAFADLRALLQAEAPPAANTSCDEAQSA